MNSTGLCPNHSFAHFFQRNTEKLGNQLFSTNGHFSSFLRLGLTLQVPAAHVDYSEQPGDPRDATCALVELLLYGYLCGIVCVLGIIGNTFSFVVIGQSPCHVSNVLLLRGISLADTATLLLWLLLRTALIFVNTYSTVSLHLYNVTTVMGYALFPLMVMSRVASVWITVIIASHRYIAVRFPLKVRKLTQRVREGFVFTRTTCLQSSCVGSFLCPTIFRPTNFVRGEPRLVKLPLS